MHLLGIGSGIGHGQNSLSLMLQIKVFIGKLLTVDALASGTVVIGKVSSLTHKVGNHAVEGAALESKALLASAECTKVFGRLGCNIGTQFKGNATNIFATDLHVKINCKHGTRPFIKKTQRPNANVGVEGSKLVALHNVPGSSIKDPA